MTEKDEWNADLETRNPKDYSFIVVWMFLALKSYISIIALSKGGQEHYQGELFILLI